MKMEQVYKFYSFQQIRTPEYDAAMTELAAMFQEAIKGNLRKKYPYSPGYFGTGQKTGLRNLQVKTGNLYKSVKVSWNSQEQQMKVFMLDYWKYVNDGRQPGKYVPLKPLVDWIKTKGLDRDPKGRFKKIGSYRGLASIISKSIKKKGIQPTNFYDDAFDVFVEEFNSPDGPAAQLGIDLRTFLINILKQPE
jgi:hypothetical protein